MGNQPLIPTSQATGEWNTITFAIPDVLVRLRDAINAVAEALLAVLNIVLQVLELIKTFLVGFLDPIVAMVEAILQEIQNLIQDIRQLGLYITGDWNPNLYVYPYADLRGGYKAFERRMIMKLADRTDISRPNLSPDTLVAGVFFYFSASIEEVVRLQRYARMLMSFFNQSFIAPSSLPVPLIKEVKYGVVGDLNNWQGIADAFTLSPTPPDVALVKWANAPQSSGEVMWTFPSPPPGGFVVTVSTIPEGISLVYDRPRADSTTQESQKTGKKVQPLEHGYVRDPEGRPVTLHGGADMLVLDRNLAFNKATDAQGGNKSGAARVYGMVGSEIIPLEFLSGSESEGKPLFQRAFWVDSSVSLNSWFLQDFSKALSLSDLPYHARIEIGTDGKAKVVSYQQPTTFYVRVAACSKDAVDKFRYTLSRALITADKQPGWTQINADTLSPSDLGSWSDSYPITFPTATTMQYLEAVQTALAVLVLSRADLPVLDDMLESLTEAERQETEQMIADGKLFLPGVAAEATGLEDFKGLLYSVYNFPQKSLEEPGGAVRSFRRRLLANVQGVALDLYNQTGANPQIERLVIEGSEVLRTVKWQSLVTAAGESAWPSLPYAMSLDETTPEEQKGTILWMLRSKATDVGLAANIYSMGVDEAAVDGLLTIKNAVRLRKPQFFERQLTAYTPRYAAPKEDVPGILALAPQGIRIIYERSIQKDGSLLVSGADQAYINALVGQYRVDGSADLSPVYFVDRDLLAQWGAAPGAMPYPVGVGPGVMYARNILAANPEVFSQAALVLGIAAAPQKKKGGGAWIALRLFDTMPGMEVCLDTFYNWVKAIKEALKSVLDAIVEYIEFFEARILELQQMIQRINSLIQAILSQIPSLPKASGLILVSNGTDGLLADFAAAKNKPQDTPASYGSGFCLVAGLLPGTSVLSLLFGGGDDGSEPLAPPFGIEGIVPEPLPGPDAEPDVL